LYNIIPSSPGGSQYDEDGAWRAGPADASGPNGEDFGELPSRNDVRRFILNVTAAAAYGALAPSRAHAVFEGLKLYLDSEPPRQPEPDEVGDLEDLVATCRAHPELLRLLEPRLTPEEIRQILAGMADGHEAGLHPDGDGEEAEDDDAAGPEVHEAKPPAAGSAES
jgi:hypothetical protein